MKKILTTVVTLLCICFTYAQQGSIRGFVYDTDDGEPIPYVTVYVYNNNHGAVTDNNGFFAVSKLQKGTYKVRLSCIGYDSVVLTFEVGDKVAPAEKYYLTKTSLQLDAVEVVAEKVIAQTETHVSVNHITPKQILRIPSIGGMADLAQYLQVLPGVVFTGDQGGQLYLRGGTPIQNKVLLDGMTIYNAFHSIGLFSVFDVDIIKSADVYTAGFGAEYGSRVSSIIDVKIRDGNHNRISGKVEMNTFGSKILLEGPIVKEKTKKITANTYYDSLDRLIDIQKEKKSGSNSLTFLLSLKGSYLSQTSKWFYPYVSKTGLPYDYLDGYGKISLQTADGSKVSFFGFSFNDRVKYSEIATYKWNSYGGGMSFVFLPKSSNMLIDGVLAYSGYKMGLKESTNPERKSGVNDLNVGMNFAYNIGKSTLSYGLELQASWINYSFTSAYGWNISEASFNSELGAYIKYKWMLAKDKLIIEPSFRLHIFTSQSAVSPEPRLAMKYNITKDIRLKLAAGLYAQNLMSTTSDQDVVNLFYGFLTVPEEVADSLQGRAVKNSLQKAQHVVLGLEFDLIPFTTMNIEGYFKNFSQLTNINRYKVFATDDDYLLETGKAYGGDVSVKFDYKGFYVNAVYSLNFVTRNDGVVIYRTHFDRRHNLNLTLSYSWGKRKNWTADLRWNYGSGFPFTKTKGVYPHLVFINGITGEIISMNEELGFALDTLNGGQLPDYHRLDISLKRKFYISETCNIDLGVGVTNVYNYSNIFYVNRKTNERIYQLPILWSFSFSLTF